MSEAGLIAAIIGAFVALLTAGITAWRFLRKDRADAEAVEEGTISGRFKDADSLMKYIDDRVEERVAPIREELKGVKAESHEMHDAVRTRETQLWLWDQRGRQGTLPALPSPILTKLGLVHLVATPIDPIEDTEPIT